MEADRIGEGRPKVSGREKKMARLQEACGGFLSGLL